MSDDSIPGMEQLDGLMKRSDIITSSHYRWNETRTWCVYCSATDCHLFGAPKSTDTSTACPNHRRNQQSPEGCCVLVDAPMLSSWKRSLKRGKRFLGWLDASHLIIALFRGADAWLSGTSLDLAQEAQMSLAVHNIWLVGPSSQVTRQTYIDRTQDTGWPHHQLNGQSSKAA